MASYLTSENSTDKAGDRPLSPSVPAEPQPSTLGVLPTPHPPPPRERRGLEDSGEGKGMSEMRSRPGPGSQDTSAQTPVLGSNTSSPASHFSWVL